LSIVNARDYKFVFSLNKQTDIRTAVADANLKYMRSLRAFNPATLNRTAIGDRAWFGKGHPFATFYDEISKSYAIPATERSATNLEAVHALAYCMGKVVTTQPNSGSAPNEYQHVITWQPTTTNKEVLYTSFGEVMGSEWKKTLVGGWVSSVTLNGIRTDHVTMSWDGGARNMEDGLWTEPSAVSAASFFKTLCGNVKLGNADGVLEDISVDVLSWTCTFNQDPQLYFMMGDSTGQCSYLTYVLVGQQTFGGSCVVQVANKYRNRILNETMSEMEIYAYSKDTINGGNRHMLKIKIPNFVVASEAMGLDGNTVAYTMNFNEEATLKLNTDEVVEVTMLTNIGTTELLVAA
jgi:hypothetical protein